MKQQLEQLNPGISYLHETTAEVDLNTIEEILKDYEAKYRIHKIETAFFHKKKGLFRVRMKSQINEQESRVFFFDNDSDIEVEIRKSFTIKELRKIDGDLILGIF